MAARRRVLITNDDGIHASGLRWLALAAAAAGHEVVVAAPDYEASGSSAALTAIYRDRRLAVTRVDFPLPTASAGSSLAADHHDGPDGANPDAPVEAFSVQASPGYVVMLAVIGTFGRRPDLVLSGINRGANNGHVVLHSGTVGAALTAANHGIPAMAVSMDVMPTEDDGGSLAEYFAGVESDSLNWATASELAYQLLPTVDTLPHGAVLNLNVPNRPMSALAGVRQATLAPFGHVQMSVAETGEGYVRTTVERTTDRLEPDTDVALLGHGYATVTVVTSIQEVPALLDLGRVTGSGGDDRTVSRRAAQDALDREAQLDADAAGIVTGTG
jgi:5'-nucleotidase